MPVFAALAEDTDNAVPPVVEAPASESAGTTGVAPVPPPAKAKIENFDARGTPAAAGEVLPWSTPAPVADKPKPDKPKSKAELAAEEKRKKDAEAALLCTSLGEDECRGQTKCAWVADIAQPDGTRTPARCAEKKIPTAAAKKKPVAQSKPKAEPKPDTPAKAEAVKTEDKTATDNKPLEVKVDKAAEKPAEVKVEKAPDKIVEKPVTVTVPVNVPVTTPASNEVVVTVPAASEKAVEKAAEKTPALIPPVQPKP